MVSQLSLEQKAFRDSCATEGSKRTQTLYPRRTARTLLTQGRFPFAQKPMPLKDYFPLGKQCIGSSRETAQEEDLISSKRSWTRTPAKTLRKAPKREGRVARRRAPELREDSQSLCCKPVLLHRLWTYPMMSPETVLPLLLF